MEGFGDARVGGGWGADGGGGGEGEGAAFEAEGLGRGEEVQHGGFSWLQKVTARIFHGMEKFLRIFPRYGKKFSTVWKTLGFLGRGGVNFSTVWKKVFHGMEKFWGFGARAG